MSTIATAPTAQPASASKAQTIALYVVLALLSALFLFAGVSKVLGSEEMLGNLAKMNIDATSAFLLGAVELVAVVLLWIPKTRIIALGMMLTILAGAVSAHVVAGDGLAGTIPLWGFCVLTAVAAALDRGELLRQFLFAR